MELQIEQLCLEQAKEVFGDGIIQTSFARHALCNAFRFQQGGHLGMPGRMQNQIIYFIWQLKSTFQHIRGLKIRRRLTTSPLDR